MFVYVITRTHSRDPFHRDELIEIHRDKSEADAFVVYKNNQHESLQPYIYLVTKKKLK